MKHPKSYLAQKLAAQRLMFLVCVTQIPVIAYSEQNVSQDTFPVAITMSTDGQDTLDIIFPMLMFMCLLLLCLAVCVTAKCLSKVPRWLSMNRVHTHDQAIQSTPLTTTTTSAVMVVPRSPVFHTHMCEAAMRASVLDHRRICPM